MQAAQCGSEAAAGFFVSLVLLALVAIGVYRSKDPTAAWWLGGMWILVGNCHGHYLHPMLYPLSEKRSFFNGLLTCLIH